MTYGSIISVGGINDPIKGYESFADEVAILEDMEAQGLVDITYRHNESSTGKKHLDLVRFTRLK